MFSSPGVAGALLEIGVTPAPQQSPDIQCGNFGAGSPPSPLLI